AGPRGPSASSEPEGRSYVSRTPTPSVAASSSSEETRDMVTDVPIISADSHITEPPDTYTARIDARFRDRAPSLVHDDKRGDLFVIDGLDQPIPMGLVAAAGKPGADPETL